MPNEELESVGVRLGRRKGIYRFWNGRGIGGVVVFVLIEE